jgi:uncharacterized protein YunC (DUF1805 family)
VRHFAVLPGTFQGIGVVSVPTVVLLVAGAHLFACCGFLRVTRASEVGRECCGLQRGCV